MWPNWSTPNLNGQVFKNHEMNKGLNKNIDKIKVQTKHKIFVPPLYEQNTNFLNNLHIINSNFM